MVTWCRWYCIACFIFKVFTDCGCLTNQGMTIEGACPTSCENHFLIFVALLCFLRFLSSTGRAGSTIIQYRQVNQTAESFTIPGLLDVPTLILPELPSKNKPRGLGRRISTRDLSPQPMSGHTAPSVLGVSFLWCFILMCEIHLICVFFAYEWWKKKERKKLYYIYDFRSVDQEDKSLSIALSEVMLCGLAFIPAPIIYGLILGLYLHLFPIDN